MSNLFLNYNVHGHSMFDGSKVKLSINNIFDDHSIVTIGAANDGTTLTSPYTTNSGSRSPRAFSSTPRAGMTPSKSRPAARS